MPDRCCQHLPRRHIPCPWSWEALCCPLIVRRRPHLGHRHTVATRTSSAIPPSTGASGCPRIDLTARLGRHHAGPRNDGAAAVLVVGDRLDRRGGPRGPPPTPAPSPNAGTSAENTTSTPTPCSPLPAAWPTTPTTAPAATAAPPTPASSNSC